MKRGESSEQDVLSEVEMLREARGQMRGHMKDMKEQKGKAESLQPFARPLNRIAVVCEGSYSLRSPQQGEALDGHRDVP